MKKIFGLVAILSFLLVFSAFAQETGFTAVGVRGGVGFGSTIGMVGGQADIVFMENLRFQPDVQVLFNGGTNVSIDFNVHYFKQTGNSLSPYVGAGVGFITGDVPDTEVLFNIMGGVEKEMTEKAKVFGEVRAIISNFDNVVAFIAGISFAIK